MWPLLLGAVHETTSHVVLFDLHRPVALHGLLASPRRIRARSAQSDQKLRFREACSKREITGGDQYVCATTANQARQVGLLLKKSQDRSVVSVQFHPCNIWAIAEFLSQSCAGCNRSSNVASRRKQRDHIPRIGQPSTSASPEAVEEEMGHGPRVIGRKLRVHGCGVGCAVDPVDGTRTISTMIKAMLQKKTQR